MFDLAHAPRAAKRVTKQAAFVRQALGRLSLDEDRKGEPPDARKQVAQNYTDNIAIAKRAIDMAEREAAARDRCVLILRQPDAVDPSHPLEAKARVCALLGCETSTLRALAEHSAEQCRQSADRAEKRLSDGDADISATLHLSNYLDALAAHGFDKSAPELRAERQLYLTHLATSKKQRYST